MPTEWTLRINTARRRVMPGYPKTEPFRTPEDLATYFAGDRVVCLLCGKTYKALGVHLIAIHAIDPDDYRERYGIPFGYGLQGQATSTIRVEQGKARHAAGVGALTTDPDTLRARLDAARENPRPRAPALQVILDRNLARINAGKTGDEARRRAAAPKLGSSEYLAHRRALAARRRGPRGRFV